MKIMKKFFLVAFTSFFASSLGWTQLNVQPSPFLNSIPALFLEPKDFDPTTGEITLHPERNEIPILGDRNRLTYTYALQEDPTSPMLFILPGTGSSATQSNTLFLAELAYKAGYSVVTLPSTSHWSFALAASSDGRTGYLPKDGIDNYRLLLTLKYRLEREENIRPRQYGLMGFSYGGLDGEQLSRQDQKQKMFGFDFLIMINTPLNLMTAIKKVDGYFDKGRAWPERHREGLRSYALGRTIDISNGRIKIDTPENLRAAFPLRDEKLAWILAQSFRDSIKESAYIAELVAGHQPANANEALTANTDIETYLKEKVFATLGKKQRRPVESLVADNNLMFSNALDIKSMKNKMKMIVFHAKDDFLSFPESIDKLESIPAELHLAEVGGHLGNLASPSVIRDLKDVLLRVKK